VRPRNTIVSRAFRDLIGQEYPAVHRNPAHWRMLDHLLFGAHRCRHSGNRLISQSLLAAIEGKEALLPERHYCGEAYLKTFKREVMPDFEWSDWNYEEGVCRVVTRLALSKHIKSAIACEVSQWSDRADCVFMADGSRATPAKRRQYRETDRCAAIELIARAGCEDAKNLLHYLNNLPPNRFTRLLDYLPAAYKAAHAIEDAAKRDHQLAVLKAIGQEAKPLYQPSENGKTVRVFPLTASMLMLRKELRRILTQEWYEADLQSSQFAICAREWNVPLVEEFLSSGEPVWPYLLRHMQLDENAARKAVLKTSLYSLMFGKSERNLRGDLLREFASETIVKLFFSCPLIQAMLDARKRRTVAIERAGGATNVYGQWLSADEHSSRSILAQLAQATELKLLSPVIDLAVEHTDPNGFVLLLWQHDGFSWSPQRGGQGAAWAKRLQDAVARQARSMEIASALIVEPPRHPHSPPNQTPKPTNQDKPEARPPYPLP
jgi:hypothetical protein